MSYIEDSLQNLRTLMVVYRMQGDTLNAERIRWELEGWLDALDPGKPPTDQVPAWHRDRYETAYRLCSRLKEE